MYRRINLGESSVWCRNNDKSSLISITYLTFLGDDGITPKLNQVCISIFSVFKAAFVLPLLEAKVLSLYTKSFQNTIARLYGISLIARQVDCIF